MTRPQARELVAADGEFTDQLDGARMSRLGRDLHTIGGAAEYVVVPANRHAPAPAGLSAADAASLVVAGATALIAVRDTVRLAPGEKVLVRGAAGAVGTGAVQLAHALRGAT